MSKAILLCDDELPILRAVEFKLKRAGFIVRLAQDGESAWSMIQEALPDLIVSDYQMPRLDGLGLAKRLHDAGLTARIPFLLLTGKGFELDHDTIKEEYGITEVLPKPFSPRELLERAVRILGRPEPQVATP